MNTLSQNKFHSFQNLRIQDLREQSLDLHRDIQSSARELGVKGHHVTNFVLPGGVPLFTAKMGEPGYLGDNTVLGEVRPILSSLANWWAVVFMWTTFCNFKFGSGLVCGMALDRSSNIKTVQIFWERKSKRTRLLSVIFKCRYACLCQMQFVPGLCIDLSYTALRCVRYPEPSAVNSHHAQ